jgi:hypothetical protein
MARGQLDEAGGALPHLGTGARLPAMSREDRRLRRFPLDRLE